MYNKYAIIGGKNMNLNVYEKTRYQNIYRHKQNKNYVIMISTPVKTSISKIDGKKIVKLDDALKIRDNPKIKAQKRAEITYKEDFDTLWEKYIDYCKIELRLAYNTIIKKEKIYNKHIKNSILCKKISKITKQDIITFLGSLDTSDKQKNEILKNLKSFFNWTISEEYLITSPIVSVKKFKIDKEEMKYWSPKELQAILNVLNNDIKSDNLDTAKKAYMVKIFILIGFSLGDRVGETRALTYNCFDKDHETVKIKHSINYDRKSNDFLSNTKNYHSQRDIDVTAKLIQEVENYRQFLIHNTEYNISNDNLIFFNYQTNKPYSDCTIRKHFKYYCRKANVSIIRMYDLRHTYVATMMAEGKELYHISNRLGHSSYSTTVNKYGHLSNQVRKQVASATDKYI